MYVYAEVLANFPNGNPTLLSRIRHSGVVGEREEGTAAFRRVCTRERGKIIRERNKVSGQSLEISRNEGVFV